MRRSRSLSTQRASWGALVVAVSRKTTGKRRGNGELCRKLPGGGYRTGMTPHPTPWTAEAVIGGERHAAADRQDKASLSNTLAKACAADATEKMKAASSSSSK